MPRLLDEAPPVVRRLTVSYQQGVEGFDPRGPDPEIAGGRDAAAFPLIPEGPIHAVDDDGVAACGYDGKLTVLDVRWGGMGSCDECRDALASRS
ncbi:MAG TPA: hypothetical protein VGX28_13305 [Frankiaceae bacterium]|nr:hypothetical protein [Frankiaceae bacterium]